MIDSLSSDELLASFGLTYDELKADERDVFISMLKDLQNNQLTVPRIQEHISKLKTTVEDQLSKVKESPTNWLTVATLFIPFLGIVRKWYADQEKVMLTARLKNYIMLEAFLFYPEKAKAVLESMMSGVKKTTQI